MAKPKYSVTVTFGIGSHIGEWTGNEQRMEEQHTFLLQTFDREKAEQVYQFVAAHKDWDWGKVLGWTPHGAKFGDVKSRK